MNFDISWQIEIDLLKMEAIILHAMGASVLIAMDRNSKYTILMCVIPVVFFIQC